MTSARRPGEAPATQHMQVKMLDRLLCIRPAVHHQPIPRIGNTFLLGDSRRRPRQPAEQQRIRLRCIREPREVLARNDENMHRRGRLGVPKCHHIVVLVDNRRRNLAAGDLAKEAIVHGPV